MNLDSLVTKEHLAARFAEQDAKIEKRFAQVESTLKMHTVLLSIVMLAVVTPLIERWLIP